MNRRNAASHSPLRKWFVIATLHFTMSESVNLSLLELGGGGGGGGLFAGGRKEWRVFRRGGVGVCALVLVVFRDKRKMVVWKCLKRME